MLTKSDLQQIGTVVDEILDEKLEEKLEKKLDEKLEEKLEEKFEEKLSKFPTKDVVYTMLDEIYKIVKSNSDESAAMRYRLQDHEERITHLEEITSSLSS